MLIYKKWVARTGSRFDHEWVREGWFLFGFIPLYVRDVTARDKLK